MNGLN